MTEKTKTIWKATGGVVTIMIAAVGVYAALVSADLIDNPRAGRTETTAGSTVTEAGTDSTGPAGEMTNAYGLYIDDILFATIKKSTDADNVLESIKKEKVDELKKRVDELKVTESSIVSVGFVQKVELVPGSFPVAQLVDAQTLLEELSRPHMAEVTALAELGDSPHSLAARFQISMDELYELNPWLEEEGATLRVGDEVTVRRETTRLEVIIIQIETRMEEVPYETRDTDTYNLFRGEIRILVKGAPGQDRITERVTYIDSVSTGEPELISRARETKPVPEHREIGQKEPVLDLNADR